MNAGRKTRIDIKTIKLSLIYVQKNIPNRDRRKTEMTQEYLDLFKLIKDTDGGLLHPIILREDKNGKYELFAGYRRFLVYTNLNMCEEVGYGRIPASIWPPKTSTEEMLLKTITENHVRTDLSSIESLESKIAIVPFFLGCGMTDNSKQNKEMGYKILKLFNSYIRAGAKKVEYIDEIIKLTNCDDPYKQLNMFFDGIGETVRNFYDKASVLMNASPKVLYLLRKKRIAPRHAKSLRTMKSEMDRSKLINRVVAENISYKVLDELIRESNIKNNPLKKRDALIRSAKNVSVILGNQKKDLNEVQYEAIKIHLDEIAASLLEEK